MADVIEFEKAKKQQELAEAAPGELEELEELRRFTRARRIVSPTAGEMRQATKRAGRLRKHELKLAIFLGITLALILVRLFT